MKVKISWINFRGFILFLKNFRLYSIIQKPLNRPVQVETPWHASKCRGCSYAPCIQWSLITPVGFTVTAIGINDALRSCLTVGEPLLFNKFL